VTKAIDDSSQNVDYAPLIRAMEDHKSLMLRELESVRMKVDYTSIISAIDEQKAEARQRHGQVDEKVSAIWKQVREGGVAVDLSPVLRAIDGVPARLDLPRVAQAIESNRAEAQERHCQIDEKVSAIRKTVRESGVAVDFSPVLRAIDDVPGRIDFSRVTQAIQDNKTEVDFTEVLRAIRETKPGVVEAMKDNNSAVLHFVAKAETAISGNVEAALTEPPRWVPGLLSKIDASLQQHEELRGWCLRTTTAPQSPSPQERLTSYWYPAASPK